MSNANLKPDQNVKSKYDQIVEQLMGVEISDNDNDYGYICSIQEVIVNCETYFKVITNLGKTFNANTILHALREVRLNEKVIESENSDDNVEVLPVGYPDGTAYSNAVFGPKRKRNPTPIMSQAINNNAKFDNGEVISITSHTSTGDRFPEEYRTIDRILTPEQIAILEDKAAEKRLLNVEANLI
jgi:hypothetical protein